MGLLEVAHHAFDEEVHDRDADVSQQQRRDGLVDAARVPEIAGDSDPDGADNERGRHHDGDYDDRRDGADHRHGDRRRGEAAEHQRAFATDHDQADARGDRHRERRQDQGRGALQGILKRERGPETAAPDVIDEFGGRFSNRQEEQRKQYRRHQQREHRDGDIFRICAEPNSKIVAHGRRRGRLSRPQRRRQFTRRRGSRTHVAPAQVIEPTTPSSR